MSTKEESVKCTGTLHTTTKSNPGKDNCCLPSSSPAYDPPRSGVRGPRLLASHPSAQQPPPHRRPGEGGTGADSYHTLRQALECGVWADRGQGPRHQMAPAVGGEAALLLPADLRQQTLPSATASVRTRGPVVSSLRDSVLQPHHSE